MRGKKRVLQKSATGREFELTGTSGDRVWGREACVERESEGKTGKNPNRDCDTIFLGTRRANGRTGGRPEAVRIGSGGGMDCLPPYVHMFGRPRRVLSRPVRPSKKRRCGCKSREKREMGTVVGRKTKRKHSTTTTTTTQSTTGRGGMERGKGKTHGRPVSIG